MNLQKKFPFGIDDIVLFEGIDDFLKINNLTREVFNLIAGTSFVKETKKQPNLTKERLKDCLVAYYNKNIEEYPNVVFFKLKKAINYFQYGNYEKGMQTLENATKQHPTHFLPKLYLAYEYVQKPDIKKVEEFLGVSNIQKNNITMKQVFPKVKNVMKTEYLKFLFVLAALNNERARVYNNSHMENKKNKCIQRVYELVSTMTFIDDKNNNTLRMQHHINTNPYYNL